MPLEVRPARPGDAPDICRAHRGSVEAWFRYPQDGPPVPATQEELSEEELWRNGGPWMVPSLCQKHLDWLLGGVGLAWVGLLDGEIVGEAEAFLGEEPPPIGRHLDLSVLYVHRKAQRRGIGSALLREVLARAVQEGCGAVLVGGGVDAPAFYTRLGFRPWQKMVLGRGDCLPGKEIGRPFEPGDYGQVAGLPMPVGRYRSARQEWEEARGPDFLPEGMSPPRRGWRLLETSAGPAWVSWVADFFDPKRATVRVWSQARPEELLPLLLMEGGALGYRQVDLLLAEEAFLRLAGGYGLAGADSWEAWWRPLNDAS